MEPRFLNRGNSVSVLMFSISDKSLQWSHGFSTVETAHSFPGHQTYHILQWSHGFSTVETGPARDPSAGRSTFNGATVSQPWKPSDIADASHPLGSFNGATVSQPWKPQSRPKLRWCPIPFNGATVSQPWKLTSPTRRTFGPFNLQWSHGFSTVETAPGQSIQIPLSGPSMEPRFLNRGNRRN